MSDAFKIEKDIPIPPKRVGALYPWKTMEVGDSFFVAADETTASKVYHSLVNSARYQTRGQPEFKFSARRVEGGVRVWRIKAKSSERKSE